MCAMHAFKHIDLFMLTFTEQIKTGFDLFNCKNKTFFFIFYHLPIPDNDQILQMSKCKEKSIYGLSFELDS